MTKIYKLCSRDDESSDHILLTCTCFSSIWSIVTAEPNMPPLSYHITQVWTNWIQERPCKEQSRLMASLLTAQWMVWKEHSNRIFKFEAHSAPFTARKIIYLFQDWMKLITEKGGNTKAICSFDLKNSISDTIATMRKTLAVNLVGMNSTVFSPSGGISDLESAD